MKRIGIVLVALTCAHGCGGPDEELASTEDLIGVTSTKCFPNAKNRWTRDRIPFRDRATANSTFLAWVPKGARVQLADRTGNGQVCRRKADRNQPNWFISVRYNGRRGYLRVDKLRATPPKQNPVPGYSVQTPFGKPGSWAAGYHTGDDYPAPVGTIVRATRPGRVVVAGYSSTYGSAYGRIVVIETEGVRHMYAHLSSTAVSAGDRVQQGTRIGRVGVTGRTTGAHLHYEERVPNYGYYDHRRPRFNRR